MLMLNNFSELLININYDEYFAVNNDIKLNKIMFQFYYNIL